MSVYHPIIKLKDNDVQALNLVSRSLAPEIAPIFEMLLPQPAADPEEHLVKSLDAFHSYKQASVPAVDLTLFKPETFLHGAFAAIAGYRYLHQRGQHVIPVVSSGVEEALWTHLPEVVALHSHGVCFRLHPEDVLAVPTPTVTWLMRRMKELGVAPATTDLLLDFGKLGAIDDEDVVIASVALLRALDREGLTFRKIIMSGSSLVDFVTEVVEAEHDEGDLVRKELGNWLRANALYGWQRPIMYSDYGVVRPGHVDKSPNPHMNGKVRYTWGRSTRYFRGCSRTKIKLADQYTTIVKRVVSSNVYKGPAFSEGDRFLGTVAFHGRLSGDMGEWVWVDMNHHLLFVARQTRALLTLAEQRRSTIEELERFAEAF